MLHCPAAHPHTQRRKKRLSLFLGGGHHHTRKMPLVRHSAEIWDNKNPPTPLPCLRGRRKGRAKHCPWQHRSCGQPMHVFVHPRHTFDPCIHTSHATFHVFCPPTGAQGSIFGLPALGFRWCLPFSDPLLTSFILVFVEARLHHGVSKVPCPWQHRSCGQPMHVFVHPRHTFDPCIHTSHATFHVFCPPTGAQGSVFGLPELGFRWSLGFSHPAALSAASGRLANAPFLAVLGSDLGGVWLFRIHCWRASFLFLFRLGCATVFVYPLRPFTSP